MTNKSEISFKDLVKRYKGIRPAAKAIGIAYSTFWDKLRKEHLESFSSREIPEPTKILGPKEGEQPKYFILTSAQDGSKISEPFWTNLKAFSDYLNAEIYIGGYTYNKSLFEDHSKASSTYHPDLVPHMIWGQLHLGDVMFLGEMNTLPTAERPLSGFETYTRDKWGVFPHPKVQMVSIPTHKEDKPKILFTTGSVTEPNYVPKKAGLKASFHHVIGALLVTLADDGSYFCRHIIADDDGSFYDLDILVKDGKINTGQSVEALAYGDIHHEKLDPSVALATWGYDVANRRIVSGVNLLDWLKPKYQFFHDLSDFDPRNHHNIQDIHFRFAKHIHGNDDVEQALEGCAQFLRETARSFCKSVVVQSNHDDALVKWLKNADYRTDPQNAIFFLKTQLSYYSYLKSGVAKPPIFEATLRELADFTGLDIFFNSEDVSFKICGDIEMGMHGHLGANGTRATPAQFTKMGNKSCVGHAHTASILDGCYTAGVSAKLDLGYNSGLSSWSQSHIIIYKSGKRAILTMMNNKFFV